MALFSNRGLVFFIVFNLLARNLGLRTVSAVSTKTAAYRAFARRPFNPCMGTRYSNPVEAVRANVFATKMFNSIGLGEFLRLQRKYRIPTFAIYPLGEYSCLTFIVLYAAHAKNGNLVLPENFPPQVLIDFIVRLLTARERFGKPYMTLRRDGKAFRMPVSHAKELLEFTATHALKVGNGYAPADVNFALHAIEYSRKILL